MKVKSKLMGLVLSVVAAIAFVLVPISAVNADSHEHGEMKSMGDSKDCKDHEGMDKDTTKDDTKDKEGDKKE